MNMPTLDLTTVPFRRGVHHGGGPETGGCPMELASFLADGSWTDRHACICPVIGAFLRPLNDGMPDGTTRARHFAAIVPRLVNTHDPSLARRRAFLAADFAVREAAPIALDAAGRTEDAARLRALPPIVDQETELKGRAAAIAAFGATYADATFDATYAVAATYAAAATFAAAVTCAANTAEGRKSVAPILWSAAAALIVRMIEVTA